MNNDPQWAKEFPATVYALARGEGLTGCDDGVCPYAPDSEEAAGFAKGLQIRMEKAASYWRHAAHYLQQFPDAESQGLLVATLRGEGLIGRDDGVCPYPPGSALAVKFKEGQDIRKRWLQRLLEQASEAQGYDPRALSDDPSAAPSFEWSHREAWQAGKADSLARHPFNSRRFPQGSWEQAAYSAGFMCGKLARVVSS